MNYPFPEITKQLQFYCTPNEYKKVTEPYLTSMGVLRSFNIGDDYLQLLPSYCYAICPFCDKEISCPVDTYSSLGVGLGTRRMLDLLYGPAKHISKFPANCEHFVGIHRFPHLHNMQALLLRSFDNKTGEIPYITMWCLPDDLKSYVVLHALPICRIDNSQFIPTFTLFSLTYFCEDPTSLIRRKLDIELSRGSNDPEFWPNVDFDPPDPDVKAGKFYDLQTWADCGLLGYLGFAQDELPLRIGPNTQLPSIYQNIRGIRQSFTWRNNQLEYRT